jgi:hypothetical protein
MMRGPINIICARQIQLVGRNGYTTVLQQALGIFAQQLRNISHSNLP